MGKDKEWSTLFFKSGPIVTCTIYYDLPSGIHIDSQLLIYTDDTSVLTSDTSIHEVQTISTIALDNINKWFMRNCLPLKTKTKTMKFDAHNQNNALFQILYRRTLTQEEINIKFLGVEIDRHMIWKMHVKLILQKLSSAWHSIRCMKHSSNIEKCRILYPAYFHLLTMYGVIF